MRATLAVYVAILIVVGAVGAASAVPPPHVAAPDCERVLDAPRHGRGAVSALGEQIEGVAAKNGRGRNKLQNQLLADSELWVDPCGRLFYSENDELPNNPPAAAPTLVFPREQTFSLHSRPGANRVVYIDFNGELITGKAWNSYYTGGQDLVAGAYDLDGAPTTFNDSELAVVQNVWLRVAEDYAPFDIDITTADPGLAAIDRNSNTDTAYGTRALVTNDATIYGACGCAGLSYVGVFDYSVSHEYYQPSLIFQRAAGSNVKVLGEVVAHEVGHSLGLSHDGNASATYFGGQGPWAPIMGTAYNRPISQWSRGEYAGANNTEDDIAVMQSHGATLRVDDVASLRSGALTLQSGAPFAGRIGSAADVDWFAISGSGQVSIDAKVAPATASPNLDLSVGLYDSAGTLLGSADPSASAVSGDVAAGLAATLNVSLPGQGTYYVKLDGTGYGDPASNGYSDYASVGEYTLTVTVSDPSTAPDVTTSTLPTALSGQSYSATLNVTGGVPPYTWGLAAGSAPLPDTLTLSANSGAINGTPSAAAGTYPVTFKVVDAHNHSSTTTLNVVVQDAPLTITSAIPLAPASLTVPYSQQLTASGGRGGYTWSLTSGSLPLGMTMSTDGLISGTPTKATSYSFTVRVTSGTATLNKTLSIVIAAALKVTTTSITGATAGVTYSFSLGATGGTKVYVWEIESGSLPAGLTMTGAKISGTPIQREAQSLVFRVTDSAGRSVLSGPLTLNVYQLGILTDPSLPAATKGQAYSTSLVADGGQAPYKWSRSSGALPSGLTLTSTGVISGTPTVSGTFTVTYKVVDASGKRSALRTFTLVVN